GYHLPHLQLHPARLRRLGNVLFDQRPLYPQELTTARNCKRNQREPLTVRRCPLGEPSPRDAVGPPVGPSRPPGRSELAGSARTAPMCRSTAPAEVRCPR